MTGDPFRKNVAGPLSSNRAVAVRELSDEVLVLRWQRGDLAAASVAIQRYERLVYGAALRVLGNAHLAEDVTQEAFLRAHQAIKSLREPAALPGWLKRISVRQAIDQLRKVRPSSLEDEDPADWRPGPAALAETADTLERFRHALSALPEPLRLAVTLRDVEGFSTSAAAEALGISDAAVKMRLSRGRRELRALLTPGEGAR